MAAESPPHLCDLVKDHAKAAFRFLSEDELGKLCPFLKLRQVPTDTVLMQEGELGAFMGFLLDGKLAVRKETTFAGKHILLAILEPGTMVGEISVVVHGQRNAS